MRIEAVETFIAGNWLLVAVTTESGLTGVGESTYFTYPQAARTIVEELRGVYVGADAHHPERQFQRLMRQHGVRDSASMGAVSALDQAMWDLKGKALQTPVWNLLGGKVRDRVRALLVIDVASEDQLITEARKAIGEGFTAIKIKPFIGDWSSQPTAKMIGGAVQLVAAVRETVGWDVDVAVEVSRNLTPDLAIGFAHELRPLRPYFIEDVIQPFSVASNQVTADRIVGTVALGERCINIWEFRDYSDAHGIAILRPDVGLAGGFTQMRKIAAIAESRHQRIVAHNCFSPVATACHIQLAACTVNWDLQSYIREDRLPWTDVVARVNELNSGFLHIPDVPGIGMQLNLEYLRSSTYKPFDLGSAQSLPLAMDGGLRRL